MRALYANLAESFLKTFSPEPFRFLIIRFTQWSIKNADEKKGRRNLWLRLSDQLGRGFDP
jgi:hypothetical protein